MSLVELTLDGRTVEAPVGMLVIEAAKRAGIEIPSFCYYEGLSLAGACRMCLVEVDYPAYFNHKTFSCGIVGDCERE